MAYSLEHAYYVQHELSRLIIKSGTNPANKCFFTDGAFVANSQLERTANTWNHDDFVVICEKEILAYFEATWNKSLNIITSFRLIIFNSQKARTATKAFSKITIFSVFKDTCFIVYVPDSENLVFGNIFFIPRFERKFTSSPESNSNSSFTISSSEVSV